MTTTKATPVRPIRTERAVLNALANAPDALVIYIAALIDDPKCDAAGFLIAAVENEFHHRI